MQTKTKTTIRRSLITLIILVLGYLIFIGYMTTNGYKDYVKFCSKYIEQIDQHKLQAGDYPRNLESLTKPNFSFRYNPKFCGYYYQSDFYGFAVREKLIGVAFYSSDINKWLHD